MKAMRAAVMGVIGLVGVAVAALAGCAHGPAYFPEAPPTGRSVIYVYRPAFPVAHALDVPVRVDGADVGELKTGGYFRQVVEPGRHVVTAQTLGQHSVTIDAEPGGAYYVKVETLTPGAAVVGPFVKVVPEAKARNEIAETKQSM